MATLLLQGAGAALGGLFGPVGAMVGRAAGALAGNLIDRSLIAGFTTIDGTRLSTARIAGADEGTAINRVYGTMRVGGTLIWATRFEEQVTTERTGAKAAGPKVENFAYFGNVAIGICEGPIAGIRRIWVDGRELDQTTVELRIHRGTDSQSPDPLIEAKQGAGNTPAYRGLAYVVFERLPLDPYGNRIPVFQFEVIRTVGELEGRIRALTLIPGATEHGYSPVQVSERLSDDQGRIINRNQLRRATDWEASIDEMLAVCPNLERVSLVVTWFGTDLRAGHCRILPGVEADHRREESQPWSVSGYDRVTAHQISRIGASPAYGGTPNDRSVIAAIADLKARGLKVYLYPFLMMDVPDGNGLPDPHGAADQAAYPWRGRISCHPAPGVDGSPDRSLAAKTEVDHFVGTAIEGDFTIGDGTVAYSGSDEGYRRLVLHYALLAQEAGGVDGFVIGSELRGLTQVRGPSDGFPFVDALIDLADDVKAIVGAATKLTYGADWSEYFGYHPADGSGDVYFNLDPLWAHEAIDAVGIDNYMPLTDFRDDDFVALQPDGARLADDEAAMRRAITSGEGYDWYYASAADRRSRTRSPITDGLAGKHWLYRYKDIEGWWSHRHFDRTGGAEQASPSPWLAKMKPIWLTELGCPAVDRGANQPNVFIDPKSSESAFPYFSGGLRSDEMQRRFLDAHLGYWSGPDAPDGMIDPDHIFLWTWDARAIPAFPEDANLYADGSNWQLGHWVNGRLGAGTLSTVIGAVLADFGIDDVDISRLSGDLRGLVAADLCAARDLIEPLAAAFRIDASDRAGTLRLQSRDRLSAPATIVSVLLDPEAERWQEVIAQESDFAAEAVIDYAIESEAYQIRTGRSRRHIVDNDRILRLSLPATLSEAAAMQTAEAMLRDHRLARRQLHFGLPPQDLTLEPGDIVSLMNGPPGRFVITRIEEGTGRQVEARETGSGESAGDYGRTIRRQDGPAADNGFAPLIHLMDLPVFRDGSDRDFAMAAASARPWRSVGLLASAETEDYRLRATLDRPARIGRLAAPLAPGLPARRDDASVIDVLMVQGELASVSNLAMLNGANRCAIRTLAGGWEIMSFAEAEEIATGHWRLTGLLRGLAGSEDQMVAGAGSEAAFVMLDDAVTSLGLGESEAGLSLNWMAERYGDGARFGPLVFAGGMRAATPLAPVHLDARRNAEGDIELRWVRRARHNADSWNGSDIPLDEDVEAYLLEILDGGTVLRREDLSAPAYLYPESLELADFGSAQTVIRFRVCQIGGSVALGLAAEKTIIL